MRHHMYNPDFKFVVAPEHFNKYTDRELLQYCLGAAMYMPGYKDFTSKILNNAMPGLTTMVLCFEDACPEERVPEAMENVHRLLATVTEAVENGTLDAGVEIPADLSERLKQGRFEECLTFVVSPTSSFPDLWKEHAVSALFAVSAPYISEGLKSTCSFFASPVQKASAVIPSPAMLTHAR